LKRSEPLERVVLYVGDEGKNNKFGWEGWGGLKRIESMERWNE